LKTQQERINRECFKEQVCHIPFSHAISILSFCHNEMADAPEQRPLQKNTGLFPDRRRACC
jgi:hypothetical protein